MEDRKLGPFRLLNLLGQGGMGAVNLARQEALDRPAPAWPTFGENFWPTPSEILGWSAGHDISELPMPGRDPLGYDDPLELAIWTIERLGAPVIALLEGTDGRLVVDNGREDGLFILWDASTFKRIARGFINARVEAFHFTAGSRMLGIADDGSATSCHPNAHVFELVDFVPPAVEEGSGSQTQECIAPASLPGQRDEQRWAELGAALEPPELSKPLSGEPYFASSRLDFECEKPVPHDHATYADTRRP
ncbi:MAG: hypothetical protein HY815_03585 [Candidatus Riflebacteria bacterium]|nr:hypothetical protein [Candidatus Riflebacteria bacterium]